MTKKSRIALLFTSRNNYQLFEKLFFKHATVDFSNYYIFNIDLDSKPSQKEMAEGDRSTTGILEKYDIIDIKVDLDDPHVYSAARDMELCIEYIEKNNLCIEWVMWCSHDCHIMGDDFFERLEEKIESNSTFKEDVGLIGFCDYGTVKIGSPIYGRGLLLDGIQKSPHGCWYENMPEEYEKADYFVVEAPQDNAVLFNIDLWKKFIEPDYFFILFNWIDDISAQFGLHGVASITIPSLDLTDLYREKPKYGVSRSIQGHSEFHHDNYKGARNQPGHWHRKYGYKRPPVSRESLKNSFFVNEKEKYEHSIQKQIFEWHLNEGPKTLDDLILKKPRITPRRCSCCKRFGHDRRTCEERKNKS